LLTRIIAAVPALVLLGASPAGQVDIGIEGLRSHAGVIRICMTMRADLIGNCAADPAALHATVPANAPRYRFDGLAAGAYAIALFHDENGNGRLDTRLGIPTEGVGFSRNPRLWFGPPRFSAASFHVGGPATGERIKLKYFF
jgi:uncharacterized protein (DUF2141 family)